MITITMDDIERVVEPDPEAEKEGVVGVVARANIPVPYGADTVIAVLETPGLWGIDVDDPDDPYLEEVFEEEVETLKEMLQHLNVRVQERSKKRHRR